MNEERVKWILKNGIEPLGDKELLKAAWWMARAEQLKPLVEAEIQKRGI